MSRIVDFPDDAHMPEACCRCNGEVFSYVEHSQSTPDKGLGAEFARFYGARYGLGRSRIILSVPVCRSCRVAPYSWIAAAVVVWGLVALSGRDWMQLHSAAVLLLAIVGLVFMVIGLNLPPVKFLSYDVQNRIVKMKLYSDAYALRLIEENYGRVPMTEALTEGQRLMAFVRREWVILMLIGLVILAFVFLMSPARVP